MPLSLFAPAPATLRLSPAQPIPSNLDSITDIGQEQSTGNNHHRDAIWQAMQRFYQTGMSPGVSLAIRHRGELIFNRALGYANLETATPLSVNTPVCLFSASKAITATLIHALIEQGKLALNDKVTTYLPDYGIHGKQNTTILDLLAHRAGIPNLDNVNPEVIFQYDAALDRVINAKPRTPPGKRQAYHAITAGYVLAGIAEKVTGKNINTLLDELIRTPLGMNYFRYGVDKTDQPLVAKHYFTGAKSRIFDRLVTHALGANMADAIDLSNDPRFMDTVIPSGNIYATAEETTRFYHMLLNGGRWGEQQIIQPGTISRATRRVSKALVLDGSLMAPVGFSAGFMMGAKRLSLFGTHTEEAFGHLGFLSITTWADPKRQLAVSMLTTGKGLLGPHLPAMFGLFNQINKLK